MANIVISTLAGKEGRPKVTARPFCADVDDSSKVHNVLTPSEQAKLARIANVLDDRGRNAMIYSEGDDAHFLYAIDQGVVRITRHLEAGDRQIMAFLWPDDLFGLAERGHDVNAAYARASDAIAFPAARSARPIAAGGSAPAALARQSCS